MELPGFPEKFPATKSKNPLKVTTPSDRELVLTRSFDAPRRLVWEAMTRPELIRRWLYLPDGWKMTDCQEDPRVGGLYRWVWAGPDGSTAMVLHGVYREVVPLERLVRTENFEFGCAPQMGESIATLSFTEQGGRTTLTTNVVYPSKEVRDEMLRSAPEGLEAGYCKLEEMLAAGAVK